MSNSLSNPTIQMPPEVEKLDLYSKATKGHNCEQESHQEFPSEFIDLMPSCKLDTSLSISSIGIAELFKKCVARNKFSVLDESPTAITVKLKRRFSLKKALKCCILDEDNRYETAAKFSMTVSEKQCLRIIDIKGLCGDPFPISALIQDFSSRVIQMSGELLSNRPLETQQDEEEDLIITCKNETNSYYEFCRILSSEAYTLGKSISEFITEFMEKYENPKETMRGLKEPVNSLKKKVEETIETLFSDYNYGKGSAGKIMLYCRPAVEKFLFSKLHGTLIDICELLASEVDTVHRAQKTDLNNEEIYEKLGISSEFHIPFRQSVEQLNRLPSLCSPNEKLNCLMGMLADAKSEVLEHSDGRIEITDHIEPFIVAYILLSSTVERPMAELTLLKAWNDQLENNTVVDLVEQAVNIIITI